MSRFIVGALALLALVVTGDMMYLVGGSIDQPVKTVTEQCTVYNRVSPKDLFQYLFGLTPSVRHFTHCADSEPKDN